MVSALSLKSTFKICQVSTRTGHGAESFGARFRDVFQSRALLQKSALITCCAQCPPSAPGCRQSHRSSRPGLLRPTRASSYLPVYCCKVLKSERLTQQRRLEVIFAHLSQRRVPLLSAFIGGCVTLRRARSGAGTSGGTGVPRLSQPLQAGQSSKHSTGFAADIRPFHALLDAGWDGAGVVTACWRATVPQR